jgi:hypothetical protein
VTLARPGVLAVALVGLVGCAEKPSGQPIVLLPHHPEKQAVHRAAPRSKVRTVAQSGPPPSSPAPAEAQSENLSPEEVRTVAQSGPPPSSPTPAEAQNENLSPEEKDSLFRDFDDYLRRSGSH